MKICLKSHARQQSPETVTLHLSDRLPEHLGRPCTVTCTFHVEACSEYYLLSMDVRGTLGITCQRCLGDFQHDYAHQTTLAVCANDDVANDAMSLHECIVVKGSEVDLIEVVTDELNLFLPEKHLDSEACAFTPIRLVD